MRALTQTVVFAGIVAFVASPALAQGPGMMMGGGGGLMLLSNPAVHKELELTEDEVSKLTAMVEESRGKMMSTMQELRDQGLEREEMMTRMQSLQKSALDDARKAMSAMLKPEQVKRFNQIELQQRGLAAFTDPEVAKALKITDAQKDKLSGIMQDMRDEMGALFQNAGGDRQAMMASMTKLRKESFEKAVALMTDEQKSAWKEMTGKPVEIPMQPGRGRGRGN